MPTGEFEFSDYGVFEDAKTDVKSFNDQIEEYKTNVMEVKEVLSDPAIFMGPVSDVCGEGLTESLSKMGVNVESFTKVSDYITTASTNYKTGDEEASAVVTGESTQTETTEPEVEQIASTAGAPVAVAEDSVVQTQPAVPASPTQTTPESASYLRRMGRIAGPSGYQETWYSQKVLPGGGLNIPGRHVDANGFVCDGDGYIVIASPNLSVYPKGSIIQTTCGVGKIYDSCPEGNVDVYTDW